MGKVTFLQVPKQTTVCATRWIRGRQAAGIALIESEGNSLETVHKESNILELDTIKTIIESMKENDLAVFKLERGGFKIELEAQRSTAATAAAPFAALPGGLVGNDPVPVPSTESSISTSGEPANLEEIVSPMVGTFYRASAPGSAPYVQIGQEINEGTVVCMIEAMKLKNEIKAEVKGTVVEILIENGMPVQYGQALMRVQ
jgi:acetyl-CoA carboxylase biotin carboxyl carrier protein